MARSATYLTQIGSLIADPTRAEVLCALMDGRARTGTELARHVGVAPSTMSEHLSKLLDGGALTVEAQGRHRYWRLADAEIARLLESMGASASLVDPPKAPAALAFSRTCYDHLAGELAVMIFDHLVDAEHLTAGTDADRLTVTESGAVFLGGLGVDVDGAIAARRPTARPCLDWTQRRHHLAGSLATAMLTTFVDKGWLRRGRAPRSIELSRSGRTEIAKRFGLSL